MLEALTAWTFTTPLGELVFDPFNTAYPRLMLTDAPSSNAQIARSIDPVPMADGAVIGDGYANERVWTFNGVLLADTHASLQEQAQLLRGAMFASLRADTTVRWTPSGFPELQFVARRYEEPQMPGRGKRKNLQFSLIAADPRVYSAAQETVTVDPSTTTGVIEPVVEPVVETFSGEIGTATNDGDAHSPPILRVYGPATTPILVNETAGQRITMYNNFQVPDGQYVEINTAPTALSVLMNGSENFDRYRFVDPTVSEFWSLAPGDNVVRLISSATGPNTRMEVIYRHAWNPG